MVPSIVKVQGWNNQTLTKTGYTRGMLDCQSCILGFVINHLGRNLEIVVSGARKHGLFGWFLGIRSQ
jgi:hypothetical protein